MATRSTCGSPGPGRGRAASQTVGASHQRRRGPTGAAAVTQGLVKGVGELIALDGGVALCGVADEFVELPTLHAHGDLGDEG